MPTTRNWRGFIPSKSQVGSLDRGVHRAPDSDPVTKLALKSGRDEPVQAHLRKCMSVHANAILHEGSYPWHRKILDLIWRDIDVLRVQRSWSMRVFWCRVAPSWRWPFSLVSLYGQLIDPSIVRSPMWKHQSILTHLTIERLPSQRWKPPQTL